MWLEQNSWMDVLGDKNEDGQLGKDQCVNDLKSVELDQDVISEVKCCHSVLGFVILWSVNRSFSS